MAELLSVSEAARALDLDPSRVRALAADGSLSAVRIGNRWAIERGAVIERSRQDHPPGRPMAPHNAWGVLFLASGLDVDWIGSSERSRLRRALRLEEIETLRPRLRRRAGLHRLRAHPGEVGYLAEDPELVVSGISAAGAFSLDLVSGNEVDGYVEESQLNKLKERFALREAEPDDRGNVAIRVVPRNSWHLEPGIAPAAAVAVDLSEDVDPRSRQAGERLLRELFHQSPSR